MNYFLLLVIIALSCIGVLIFVMFYHKNNVRKLVNNVNVNMKNFRNSRQDSSNFDITPLTNYTPLDFSIWDETKDRISNLKNSYSEIMNNILSYKTQTDNYNNQLLSILTEPVFNVLTNETNKIQIPLQCTDGVCTPNQILNHLDLIISTILGEFTIITDTIEELEEQLERCDADKLEKLEEYERLRQEMTILSQIYERLLDLKNKLNEKSTSFISDQLLPRLKQYYDYY